MADTVTKLVFDVEMGPEERRTGLVHLSEQQLDDGQVLDEKDRIELRDQDGVLYAAVVQEIERTPTGHAFRAHIQP